MVGKRILVVDDEALVLESIRMTLLHFGYAVESTSSASEALALLKQTDFDLVLTDRKMPGMSGEQFAKEVKALRPVLPVILLTGYPPDCKPSHIDAVLVKPFAMLELQETIQRLIRAS